VFYEVGHLVKRGRLREFMAVRAWRSALLSLGIREVAVSAEIAMRASDLENLPGDPLDRLVVATALVERAALLTADQPILSWPGQLAREDAQR
jgi:PIN domain nuclease of toxin-antitoxin system